METAVDTSAASPPAKRTIPGPRKPRKTNAVQQAMDVSFKALISQGIPKSRAAKILGLSETAGYKIAKRLQAKGEDVSGLLSAEGDEKLKTLVYRMMDKGAKIRKIKGSDAIGAAKLYADRRFPIRQESGGDTNISFTVVNLNSSPAPGPENPPNREIDVSPER